MTELYKFEPMLGPADQWPVGSPEWAERTSQKLQLATRSVTRQTVHYLKDLLKEIIRTKPWLIWPIPPFNTPDDYCQKVTGYSWRGLLGVVTELIPDRELELTMRAENAKAQVEYRPQGTRTDLLLPYDIRKLSTKGCDGGTSRDYLLRRLARKRPDLLEKYKNGEFRSVRAVAIEAGFIKK